MNIWIRLRILKLFIQLVRDPSRTELIFEGVEVASKNANKDILQTIEKVVMANAGFRKMFEEHYIPEAPSMQKLAQCREGTYGHAVYEHMKNNNLDFSLWPKYESLDFVHYFSTRIYQDHDLWHALLGYNVSIEDELGLQAFGLAQFNSPVAVLLITGGLLHLLMKDPRRAIAAFRKISAGYSLGLRASLLLSVRLHELFERPLQEVRELCGIEVAPPNLMESLRLQQEGLA